MKTRNILIFFYLIFFLFVSAGAQNTDQDWTKSYEDPIKLAKEVIARTNTYWTYAGKTIFITKFANKQMPSEKYSFLIFFESPYLNGKYINKNNYKNLIKKEKNEYETLIDQFLRKPVNFSKNTAKATLRLSIYQYNKAFKIADRYKRYGTMSKKEALEFLENRWSILKIVQANALLKEKGTYKNNKNYEDFKAKRLKGLIDSKNITTKRIQYLSETIGPGSNQKFENCAHFAKIMYQEAMLMNLGIAAYEPYKTFKKRMDYLNQLKIDELERFNMFDDEIAENLKTIIYKPNSRTIWNFSDKHMKIQWNAPLYDSNKSMNIILWKGDNQQIKKSIAKNTGSFEFIDLPDNIKEGNDYFVSVSPSYLANYEKNFFAKSEMFTIKKETAVSFSIRKEIVPVRTTFGNRNVRYIKEITVPTKYITVEAYDHGQIDGDIISLYLNGKVIIQRYTLQRHPISVQVELDENIRNDIFLYAHNVGDIPPNTVALRIKYGYNSTQEILRSDLSSCEAIVIRVRK